MYTTKNLAFDLTRGVVPAVFAEENPVEVLRQALIDANGGSTKFDRKALRKNKPEIFDIIEEIIPVIIQEGLKGDEFYTNLVEEKRAAETDKFEFWAEDNSEFIVSILANGIATPRRQRIGQKRKVTIETTPHAIRFYEEFTHFMTGRWDWNELINKVAKAFKQQLLMETFGVFSSISATTPGLSADYIKTGTYDEELLLSVVDHVEASSGARAILVGTKPALRKLTSIVLSDEAKSAYYNGGFYGKLAGVDAVSILNRHVPGTTNFIFPDNEVYVMASDDKPIKVCYEGNAFVDERTTGNADMSTEYTYIENIGIGLIVNGPIGKYTIT